MFIPARRFLDFCKLYEQDFGFYPLWIVPYRVPDAYPWLNPEHFARMADDLLIDCAVYGMKNNGESDDPPQRAGARRKGSRRPRRVEGLPRWLVPNRRFWR